MEAGRPFVVHGREQRAGQYGWVDMDNYDNFYRLMRLLIANGHRRFAFINGDETFNYALYRHHGVRDAIADAGLPADSLRVYNSAHPMGDAGFRLTQNALADTRVTAVLPKLRSLDVIAVTKEDRVRANIYGKIREEKMRKEEG